MIEASIKTLLRTDTAIQALVGDRVSYIRSRQSGEYPCITFQRRGTQRDRHLLGPSGLARCRFQIDCWASSQTVARQLAEAVRLRIDNYSGDVGDHNIQRMYVDDDLDDWEWELAGKDAIIGRVTLIVGVWFSEALPAQ